MNRGEAEDGRRMGDLTGAWVGGAIKSYERGDG